MKKGIITLSKKRCISFIFGREDEFLFFKGSLWFDLELLFPQRKGSAFYLRPSFRFIKVSCIKVSLSNNILSSSLRMHIFSDCNTFHPESEFSKVLSHVCVYPSTGPQALTPFLLFLFVSSMLCVSCGAVPSVNSLQMCTTWAQRYHVSLKLSTIYPLDTHREVHTKDYRGEKLPRICAFISD